MEFTEEFERKPVRMSGNLTVVMPTDHVLSVSDWVLANSPTPIRMTVVLMVRTDHTRHDDILTEIRSEPTEEPVKWTRFVVRSSVDCQPVLNGKPIDN